MIETIPIQIKTLGAVAYMVYAFYRWIEGE